MLSARWLCALTLLLGAELGMAADRGKEVTMDEDTFWGIVDGVHRAAGANLQARIKLLQIELGKRSVEDIQAFQRRYDEQIAASYRWDLWGAAYVMNGGCSDDGFRYFRDWLISEGRRTFDAALKSPESLADLPKVELAENELFGYVALDAFEGKGGGELDRDMSTEGAEPAGKSWDERDLPRMFPRLSAKYP